MVPSPPTLAVGRLRDADALVVGVVPADLVRPSQSGDRCSSESTTGLGWTGFERVVTAVRAAGMSGRPDEVRVVALDHENPCVVVAVGLGDAPDAEQLRRAAGAGVQAVPGSRTVALDLPAPGADALRAIAEGALLGSYTFERYRSRPAPGPRHLLMPAAADTGLLHRASVVAEAIAFARDLVNTPPSDLFPEALADVAQGLHGVDGLGVEVLDERALRDGGYGGIAGVGQGSARPPRLIHVSYRGSGEPIAFVGKGVTFDSGGLSLKRPAELPDMKMDMAGAAAALGAVRAIARLGYRIDVDAWLPAVENMPGGGAIRPSDVLTMRNGLRVEVRDTDNEGRLILADAITRAGEDEPGIVIDIATLTSAQIIALGLRTAAVMANDNDLRADLVAAADRAGEPTWPMPLPAYLRTKLDSTLADLTNVAPPEAAMLTAGLFLREFVRPGIRWGHLDIAGPAYNVGEPHGYTPRGGTGAGLRTLVQFAEERQSERGS
jgi:leucyl aminopeptidase